MCRPYLLIPALPDLPDTAWKQITLSRSEEGALEPTFSEEVPLGLDIRWTTPAIEVLSLKRGASRGALVYETEYEGKPAIAKIVPFAWQNYRLENESWAYSLIEGYYGDNSTHDRFSPRVLGHLTEEGRAMGILLEKVEGRFAEPAHLEACDGALRKLHKAVRLAHGDVNRRNFIIDDAIGKVTLIDFEHAIDLDLKPEVAAKELLSLLAELSEETGRGGSGQIVTA
ncbi:hypothetical protein LTR95_007500 [Oleoguttula sp. CCFEE 5521]